MSSLPKLKKKRFGNKNTQVTRTNSRQISFNKKSKNTYVNESEVSFDLSESMIPFLNDHLNTELLEKLDPTVHELEFRIGRYNQFKNFDAYVPRLVFNRMITYYHQNMLNNLTENISLDIIYDNNFRCTITGQTLKNSKTEVEYFCKTNRIKEAEFMEKVQLQKSDNYDWNFRLTSSSERPISNQTQVLKIQKAIENKTISKFYRYKYRYSFQINDEVRLDFTIIKETPKGSMAGTLISSRTLAQKEKYQVEMEYTGQNFDIGHLQEVMTPQISLLLSLFMGVKGSYQPISLSHKYLVLTKYLQLSVGVDKVSIEELNQKQTTSKFLAMDVEALTRQNFNQIHHNYMVTVKADGEHYLLYMHPDLGMYLINNRLDVSPVVLNELKQNSSKKNELQKMGECVFDGELVEYDGKFRFLIFDCFFYGSEDRRDLNMFDKKEDKFVINEKSRMFYIKTFMKAIENENLSRELAIEEKQYRPLSKVGFYFKKNNNGQYVMKEDEFPYNVDGLVFAPINEPYPKVVHRSGRYIKKGSMDDPENISPILKFKPPQFLSVDFRVNFDGAPKYQKINGTDYQVMTLESAYGSKIYPFEPSCYRVRDYNKVYVPLTKGQPQLVERKGYRVDEDTLGHIIRDRDILEFIWIPDRSFGNDYYGIWFPIKYREDKTATGYPNNYRKVADKTWMAIHDQQILPENLMDPYGRDIPSPQLDMGYYQNLNRESLPNLRNIHNSLKSLLIFLAIKQTSSKSNRFMDLATGRGGDLLKLMWAGVNYAFGVEFDEGNLKAGGGSNNRDASAYGRYRDMIEKAFMNDKKVPFKLDLVQGDMRELFSEGNVSNEAVFNYILKEKVGRGNQSFGVISCQFAMHYACDSEEHIDNFFRNVSSNLVPGGYFIATTFDGDRVLNALQGTEMKDEDGKPIIIGKNASGKIMWSISAPLKYKKLENVGQQIFVFNKTIKDEEEVEYLVNFNYLTEVAQKYDLYPSRLSLSKYNLPLDGGYGVGAFSQLYEDPYLDLIGETVYPRGSNKYKELERSLDRIDMGIKKYSKLSSFFILRKQN